jgi:hypothetical protein
MAAENALPNLIYTPARDVRLSQELSMAEAALGTMLVMLAGWLFIFLNATILRSPNHLLSALAAPLQGRCKSSRVARYLAQYNWVGLRRSSVTFIPAHNELGWVNEI